MNRSGTAWRVISLALALAVSAAAPVFAAGKVLNCTFGGKLLQGKVQVVFNVQELKGFTKKGEPDFGSKRDRARGKGSNISGLISVLLLVGIAAFLLGGNRDGGQDLVTDVTAEAMVLPDDTPAVKLSWRPDGFVKGNNQRFQWQIDFQVERS